MEENQLNGTDLLGYNFEINTLKKLEEEGFGCFITYHNPLDKHQWKRTRGKGIDARIVIGENSLDIDFSYMSNDYWYRKQWFIDSRVPRFRKSKDSDEYHQNLIVTNRPHNYDSVRYEAQQSCGGIYIITIEQLITLLNSIILRHNSIINNTIDSNNQNIDNTIDNNTITNYNISINNTIDNQITCMHQQNSWYYTDN